eukprot:COSAG05_NODE_278_length_12330_cov_14.132205_12_plen_195_part_00
MLLDTQRGCRRSVVARLVRYPTPPFSIRRVSPLNPTLSFSNRRECGGRLSRVVSHPNPITRPTMRSLCVRLCGRYASNYAATMHPTMRPLRVQLRVQLCVQLCGHWMLWNPPSSTSSSALSWIESCWATFSRSADWACSVSHVDGAGEFVTADPHTSGMYGPSSSGSPVSSHSSVAYTLLSSALHGQWFCTWYL